MKFLQIGTIDVTPLLLQLHRHENRWNEFRDRTTMTDVHSQVSDIWLRYRPFEQLISKESYNEPFWDMEWYPAFYDLPEVRTITQALMLRTNGTALGGTLITKIPPGGYVKPHSDAVSWHARHYHTKIYTVLQGNGHCVNMVEDEAIVMKTGECWVFNNLKVHSVVNNGVTDRISLITSIRCD